MHHQFEKPPALNLTKPWGWRIPFLMGTLIAPVGIYLRRHIQEDLGQPPKMSMLAGVASSVISLVTCPIYGAWSDRMARRKPLTVVGRIALIVLLYPAFWLMTHFPSLPVVLATLIVLMLCYTMGSVPAYALMPGGKQ